MEPGVEVIELGDPVKYVGNELAEEHPGGDADLAAEGWTGLSVLYLCPLKALLNNLLPRLEVYGAWAGRRVALWHGDTPASRRKSILTGPPDLL